MNSSKIFTLKAQIDALNQKDPKKLRQDTLNNILQKKLDRTYDNYNRFIDSKVNYILSRSNYRVIKAINKFKNEKNEEVVEDEYNY